ncbi:hypothetical protein HPP92_007197 [Vanilla planifolia]|uniref:Uncharacterized protein n=1 Tax=Vanilla planifolia TaxID=51239 RepID=A0A835RFW8_VANPL|nr:hypothetical protein HPP92_007197 [Vanilla planifolia]
MARRRLGTLDDKECAPKSPIHRRFICRAFAHGAIFFIRDYNPGGKPSRPILIRGHLQYGHRNIEICLCSLAETRKPEFDPTASILSVGEA